MIGFLRGRLLSAGAGQVVVDVGGIGFVLQVAAGTLARLPAPGGEVGLHATFLVREDGVTLFGFPTAEEKALFELLLGVSGVGPRLALSALSTLGADALAAALARGDAGALVRVPGIGPRTAERLVFELRDRVRGLAWPGLDEALAAGGPAGEPPAAGGGRGGAPEAPGAVAGPEVDAAAALEALGYSGAEAARAVAAVRVPGERATAEELVRRALRSLARGG